MRVHYFPDTNTYLLSEFPISSCGVSSCTWIVPGTESPNEEEIPQQFSRMHRVGYVPNELVLVCDPFLGITPISRWEEWKELHEEKEDEV